MAKSIHSRANRVLLELLVKARKTAVLTQEQLARRLQRPQSFVAKYENGERRLDVVEFLRIARETGTNAAAIIRAVDKAV
jgi:transcriptional regulator with XRE-family HTH domain